MILNCPARAHIKTNPTILPQKFGHVIENFAICPINLSYDIMSNALLNGELFAEVKELDQRYGNPSFEVKKPKKVKKYKTNPRVERLEKKVLKSSSEDTKVKQAKVVEKNVEKLLSKSKPSAGKYESIIQQLDSTKRHFEPKGRKLLSKKKKVTVKRETSAFTEEDFENFSQEYFVHSKPLKKDQSDALD